MNGTAAGTLVLVTGDGAGSLVGRGNIPLIRFARHNGLGVEVVAITFTLNRRLAAVAQVMGSLEFLDPYYDAITYTDQRSATSIDDRARRTERAHPWSPVEDAQIKLVLASPDYDHVLRAAIAVRVAEPDRRLIAKLLAVFGTYLASGLGPEEAAARAEGDDTMTLAERVRALLALRIVNDAMNVPQG